MILRRALEQESTLQDRIPCNERIVVVFDEPARLLARRLAQRMNHLMRQGKTCLDTEHQILDEFRYEILMCGIRLLQDTLVLRE